MCCEKSLASLSRLLISLRKGDIVKREARALEDLKDALTHVTGSEPQITVAVDRRAAERTMAILWHVKREIPRVSQFIAHYHLHNINRRHGTELELHIHSEPS